jgi:NAD(P)-dependent dehydrogenase (short-subunit alcohol dehydrogenase family)
MSTNRGRVIVVTGGASGIGAACAQVLAGEGARVVVADLNLELAQEVAQRIGGQAWQIDVAEVDSVEQAARDIEQQVGPVYGLVNSAGILQQPFEPYKLNMDTWDLVQRVDFRGTYIACLAFGRAMLARGAGSIVNISSVTGHRSAPLHSYAPAKAAVISMTQCLAAEWGPSKVRVNSVAPGYTLTPALQAAVDRGERSLDQLLLNAPMNDTVKPAQVGDAVSFLLSDRAQAITGVDLPVDCGWLAGTAWSTYGGFRSPASAL